MLIALGLTDMMDALGASWVAASRVGTALALVASDTFDVAIIDMKLAGEPADAVMDALSARDIPFIITTGYGAEVIAEKYRNVPRFTKPYMPAHVEAALVSVLAPGKLRSLTIPRSLSATGEAAQPSQSAVVVA
jgi:ActR/RegA family two-component response regulator